MVDGGAGGAVPMFGGRCVGGTTTINTKVAFRAHDFEFAKWHEASGLLGDGGAPFGLETLAPHYERVERALGVRERARLAAVRADPRRRLPRARRRARAGRLLHRPQLHAVRLLPAGLSDERRQEHDEHLHPRRHRGRQARPAGGLAGRAGAPRATRRRPRGDRRRVRRRRTESARRSRRAQSSSRPGRSTRLSS